MKQAIQQALNHPLLDAIPIEQAKGLIINFIGGASLTMHEVGEALNELSGKCHPDAEIIPGMTSNPLMQDRVELIMLVTGVGATAVQTPIQAAASMKMESNSRQELENKSAPSPIIHSTSKPEPQDELEIPAYLRKHIKLNIDR